MHQLQHRKGCQSSIVMPRPAVWGQKTIILLFKKEKKKKRFVLGFFCLY